MPRPTSRLRRSDREEIMTMDKKTKKRLESAGWKVGDTSEFLDLTGCGKTRRKTIAAKGKHYYDHESGPWINVVRGQKSFFRNLLSAEEAAIVELRVGLASAVRDRRNRRSMTQEQLGRLLGSSQSRVAKMEAADPSVSIDLMVRSLLRMGASRKEVASCIAAPRRQRAA